VTAGSPDHDRDEPLAGGRMTQGIVRRGDRVLRPMGPWSPSVHEYLRHLAAAGFPGAPQVLGTEGDREVLTFLPGEVAADPHWRPGHGHRLPSYVRSEAALRATARLLRRLHDAAAGFRPACTGYRFSPRPPRPGEIVSHGDLGPWNTVYRDGLPVAFIDWDSAQPTDPLTDLAAAAWAFVPLARPGWLAEAGFPAGTDVPARLRLFADAYGLPRPTAILPALARSKVADLQRIRSWPLSAAEAADVLELTARELRWLHDSQPALARALGPDTG